MMKQKIKIGWAQSSITPTRPVIMLGQMYQRVSQYVHDPITATAMVIENGIEQTTFVSMDMTEVPVHAFEQLREMLKEYKEIDFNKISFNVTHSHNSTDFFSDFMRDENEHVYGKEILPQIGLPQNLLTFDEAQKYFVDVIGQLIIRAWESRKEGGVSTAHDYAVVGFNRRPVFMHNGEKESIMYGDCSRPDFVRFEGGVDNAVEMLYTWNKSGELTGVVVNVPCPSQVYELHSFISADYWCPTRSEIREKLGNIYILPVCGAAGDLAPIDLVKISKTNKEALLEWGGQTKEVFRNFDMTLECQQIAARISEAVVRGYKTAKNYIDYIPVFKHQVLEMKLPIRKVSEEDYRKAMKQVGEIKAKYSKENPMTMKDLVAAFEPQGVVIRYEQQNVSDKYSFKCHILRIGNIAVATNPFELYHEFAQRIKARAEAEQVFIIQLSNGLGGYLPTRDAVNGGSYSSKPASTCCGPDGGDVLVEETLKVIGKLWS